MDMLDIIDSFLEAIKADPRIGPVHISMYVGLVKLWKEQNFKSPFAIFSFQVMAICKISGLATYHQKIKELHQYGYLKYYPSFNHFDGSQVQLRTEW